MNAPRVVKQRTPLTPVQAGLSVIAVLLGAGVFAFAFLVIRALIRFVGWMFWT